MSTKTGVAPTYIITSPVAAKVNGVVITSSSFPTSATTNAKCSAAVQELTAIACSHPICALNLSSKFFVF